MTPEAFLSIPLAEVTLEARLARGPDGPEGSTSVSVPSPLPGPSPQTAPGSSPGPLWILGHPHPLYGGSMENGVVLAVRDAILAAAGPGAATLRWNSRGVGRSSGEFGEGEDEARDLAELLSRLSAGARGGPPLPDGLCGPWSSIGLAGYSFGAFVAAGALALGARPQGVMLFSPPLDFMSFEGLAPPRLPCLITLGDRDEFCRRSSLMAWLGSAPEANRPRVEILRGVDHFYFGAERALGQAVREFLSALSLPSQRG